MGVKPAPAIFLSVDLFPSHGSLVISHVALETKTPNLTLPYQGDWPRAWEGLDLGP